MCHTFYHVYITFLKEMALPQKRQGGATLVLSRMSNDFGTLDQRIRALDFFEEVIWYDEKRESHFPELAKYRKDRGNIVLNMWWRIRFTSRFAKLQEPYVPVDFKEYRDVYVFCDTDPIGLYLNKKHIPYHAMEDGLDCLATRDMARISNAGHFEMKARFAAMNLIFIENGYSKYCIDMEVNDRSKLKYDYRKYKEVPRAPLYERLTEADKEILVKAFVENADALKEELAAAAGTGKKTVLILTDPLCDLETRKQIIRDQLEMFGKDEEGKERAVFIKPHPRDELDYKALLPQIPQISPKVPMEILNLFPGLHFDTVVSVFTHLDAIEYADEKVFLGDEFMDRYEPEERHWGSRNI